jgi:hypothetical protein
MIEWYPGSDCKAVMTRNVSRRELLRSGTSAASILILGVQSIAPGSAATSLALDQFMSISTKLTGQPSLDGDMGQKILDAFVAAGQGGNIATLFEDATPERNQTGIANAIDPPPLKWSDLKYVLWHQGGSEHAKEETHA